MSGASTEGTLESTKPNPKIRGTQSWAPSVLSTPPQRPCGALRRVPRTPSIEAAQSGDSNLCWRRFHRRCNKQSLVPSQKQRLRAYMSEWVPANHTSLVWGEPDFGSAEVLVVVVSTRFHLTHQGDHKMLKSYPLLLASVRWRRSLPWYEVSQTSAQQKCWSSPSLHVFI